MKKLLLKFIIVSLFLTGCSGLVPNKIDRKIDYKEQYKSEQSIAYSNVETYLATSLIDSKSAIQLKNKPSQIVTKYGVSCDEAKPKYMFLNSYTLYYTINIQFKPNKIKLNFIINEAIATSGSTSSIVHLTNLKNEGIKKCSEKIKNDIMNIIDKQSDW